MKLTNDLVFKYVFGTDKRTRALVGLLNAVLNLRGQEEIVEVVIQNPFNYAELQEAKSVILDVLATDAQKRIFNLEMQINPEADYAQRIVYYGSKVNAGQLKEGDAYSLLKQLISISFLEWKIGDVSEIHSTYRFLNIETHHQMPNFFEIHFIQLPRFDINKPVSECTPLECWLNLLIKGEFYMKNPEEMPKELLEINGVQDAMESYTECSASEPVKRLMDAREKTKRDEISRLYNAKQEGEQIGLKKGEQIGIKKGEQIGIKKGKAEGKAEGRVEGEKIGLIKGQAENMLQLYEKGVINFEICLQGLEPLRSSLPEDVYASYLARLHKKVD